MSYFTENYKHLCFPIADNDEPGFRVAQIAALNAVNAHFFSKTSPAIVVMPTGTGKSAVLVAAPFVMRSNRVLVITPSRLVREQLGENFQALADLRKLGAIETVARSPAVHVVDSTINDANQWNALRAFDVVIATVPSLVPRQGQVPTPPDGLFDLVLVDEAHHAPARTWAALLEALSSVKQVLFTATPFRRDEREVIGQIVFRYDLRRARGDGIFGEIKFEAVTRIANQNIDITIAKASQVRFMDDRAAGLRHLVMVRADTIERAKELKRIYADHTSLRLAFVSGQHTLKHVRKILRRLEQGEVDGIVCVNMFGEGFNLPSLKIAAIHSPHKSLAITLQFIGRFARRTEFVGEATFLAEPHESSAELGALYEEGSAWRELVTNLSDSRIEEEVTTRDVIDSFDSHITLPDLADFSLYTLRPYCHAKVYRVADIDMRTTPDFNPGMDIVYFGISEPRTAAVYITREATYPQWSADDRFCDVSYDVFVFYFIRRQKLLFICATRRNAALYDRLVTPLTKGAHTALSSNAINRVLRDLKDISAFSLGLRVRNPLGRTESYQQRTGGSVDRTVQQADARRFDRGHLFAKALDGKAPVTIGVSSSSKVWSNEYLPIPRLLKLFDRYAEKITNARPVLTSTGLDLVSAGEEIDQVPDGIFAAIWAYDTYADAPMAIYPDSDGVVIRKQLLDFDLTVLDSREGYCLFQIASAELRWRGRYAIGDFPLIAVIRQDEPPLAVEIGRESMPIAEYLNDALPSFYRTDLSRVEGTSLYPERSSLAAFDVEKIRTVDWDRAGIDCKSEKTRTTKGESLFEWVVMRAREMGDGLIYCDDGPGEVADFITSNLNTANPVVRFYHCKSSQDEPGARQSDFYEVLGQAMRTSPWFDLDKLERQIRYRLQTSVPGFREGGDIELRWMREPGLNARVKFEVYVVQPGLNKGRVSAQMLEQFAGVANHLHAGGAEEFAIFASKIEENDV